jgi:hypothetical protein
MSDEQAREVLKIALASLKSLREIGIVHSLRIYCAHDEDTCDECKSHASRIIPIEDAAIGTNIPPFAHSGGVRLVLPLAKTDHCSSPRMATERSGGSPIAESGKRPPKLHCVGLRFAPGQLQARRQTPLPSVAL